MLIDLTKLEECCFPAVHSIGSRGLEMFDVYYVNVPDIKLLVSLEFACRVDEHLRKLVFTMLGESAHKVEIDAKTLLTVARMLYKQVNDILEDYCDGVYVGTLDGGDEVDDILNAIDRYTQLLLGGFCAGIRYNLAGAYAVSLCKVNNEESYVIRLDRTGEDFDKANARKVAQNNSWENDFNISVGFIFLWLGKCVRFNNAVHIEMRKDR